MPEEIDGYWSDGYTDFSTLTLIVPLILFMCAVQTDPSFARGGFPSFADTGLEVPNRTFFDETEMSRLKSLADRHDTVHAILQLDLQFEPEGQLSNFAKFRQRNQIKQVQSRLESILAGTKFQVTHRYKTIPSVAVSLSASAVEALQGKGLIDSVSLDSINKAFLSESIPHIEADRYHRSDEEGEGGMVVVIDSGMDLDHPAFGGRIAHQACFTSGSNCPDGSDTQIGSPAGRPFVRCNSTVDPHGTHVGGIVGGQQTSSTSPPLPPATAPNVRLASIMAKTRTCPGSGFFDSDLLAALEHVSTSIASSYDVRAVNMSLGGGRYHGYCDDVKPNFKDIIDTLRSKGIATVVASGNTGYKDSISAPACVSSAIAVGATKIENSEGNLVRERIASFSNQDPKTVDLVAPGANIRSAWYNDTTTVLGGTSMAAPHVAGAWVLFSQLTGTKNVRKIEQYLIENGKTIRDNRTGAPPDASYTSIRIGPNVQDPFEGKNCLIGRLPYSSNYREPLRTFRDYGLTTPVGRWLTVQYYYLSSSIVSLDHRSR